MDAGDRPAGNDIEEDLLARAIADLGIAITGETAVWEEGLTVDTPVSAAAEQVHAVFAATRHPLLPGPPAASDDPREISWFAGVRAPPNRVLPGAAGRRPPSPLPVIGEAGEVLPN